jgi:ABC-type nitrate/sulfonate/bicarbonate transport system permease component
VSTALPDAARDRAIQRTLLVEGSANVLVLGVKIVVGVATSSAAVISDAIHSFADLANNGVALGAARIAAAPPDREHPYGHRRYETLAVFLLATLLAVPIGILCGMSRTMESAFNPFVQVFKPISPLAWLPLVTLMVSALYVSEEPLFEKSFVISAITVALCSLWPTVINTALGVSSIDRDLLNVARVLKLDWKTRLVKLVLPSSLPLMFTGMRLSLGVGWMVLIAAEMLAQNPGLGKFVWDEFQNGSAESLSRMLVAVFTIGLIGFLLDRMMQALQSLANFSARR